MTTGPTPQMRTAYLQRVSDLSSGQPIAASDAVALAADLLDLARQVMPGTWFAVDSRCQLARAVLAANTAGGDGIAGPADELPADDFTQALVGMCRSALRNHGGHPYGGWSSGEKLGVALVLRDREYLEREGMTPTQAARRVLGGMLMPPPDVNVWLATIRKAIGLEQ